MISMTVLTDGRKEYISKALPTWIDAYGDEIEHKTIIDDSGDRDYRQWLSTEFPSFSVVYVSKNRGGYTKAMNTVFQQVRDMGQQYNLHVEDDFILKRKANLSDIIKILDSFPDLSQMSLMREPWYPHEINSGGLVEALEDQGNKVFNQKINAGLPWVRHPAYWTANPNVFPAWVAQRVWPEAPWSEMQFGQALRRERKVSGIWGMRPDWIYTEHIGGVRSGTGY